MFTFKDYWNALDGVGPKLLENILERARQAPGIDWPEFKKLVDKAYPCGDVEL